MPSSYDPRPTDLALADDCLENAAILFELAMVYRRRAGLHTLACYEAAARAVAEERAAVRIEAAILDKLASARVAAGDLDDDP